MIQPKETKRPHQAPATASQAVQPPSGGGERAGIVRDVLDPSWRNEPSPGIVDVLSDLGSNEDMMMDKEAEKRIA